MSSGNGRCLGKMLQVGDMTTLWVKGELSYEGTQLNNLYAGVVVEDVRDDIVYFYGLRKEINAALNRKYVEGRLEYEYPWNRRNEKQPS